MTCRRNLVCIATIQLIQGFTYDLRYVPISWGLRDKAVHLKRTDCSNDYKSPVELCLILKSVFTRKRLQTMYKHILL